MTFENFVRDILVSPGLTAGRGLKQTVSAKMLTRTGVSPGLTAGRGLKPPIRLSVREQSRYRPASRPGAD